MHQKHSDLQRQALLIVPSRRIKLAFKDIHTLWNFTQSIGASSVEINMKEHSLYCNCSEKEIGLAIKKFGASLVEGELLS